MGHTVSEGLGEVGHEGRAAHTAALVSLRVAADEKLPNQHPSLSGERVTARRVWMVGSHLLGCKGLGRDGAAGGVTLDDDLFDE